MATGEQIKALIKAHYGKDDNKFKTVVLQIAAAEARAGHTALARELKDTVEKVVTSGNIIKFKSENELFQYVIPDNKSSELVVSEEIQIRIERILSEYRQREKLNKFGMKNRRKILVEGLPGTGKTLTAYVLASELNLPLYIVQMDKIVTKFMGETSAKLRQIFEMINGNRGLYLFDEFDAIGADRSLDNEVGEMRRVLNSFLQFLEQDDSDSIIVAATNNHKMLDTALFRRFDDILHYSIPDEEQIRQLIKIRLGEFYSTKLGSAKVIEKAYTLSHAEISKSCEDCIKYAILNDAIVTSDLLIQCLSERISAYVGREVK